MIPSLYFTLHDMLYLTEKTYCLQRLPCMFYTICASNSVYSPAPCARHILSSVLLLEEQGVDDAADADDEDGNVERERGHGLIAELHVLPAKAIYHVWHGLVVLDVELVRILKSGPELLQPAALGLLRQRPVVESSGLLLAEHVVHLTEPDELLRCRLERQPRGVRVVLLGQPPVRRLDLLYVRLRCYSQELVV